MVVEDGDIPSLWGLGPEPLCQTMVVAEDEDVVSGFSKGVRFFEGEKGFAGRGGTADECAALSAKHGEDFVLGTCGLKKGLFLVAQRCGQSRGHLPFWGEILDNGLEALWARRFRGLANQAFFQDMKDRVFGVGKGKIVESNFAVICRAAQSSVFEFDVWKPDGVCNRETILLTDSAIFQLAE